MPNSTKGRRSARPRRASAPSFRVFLVKGKSRISCKRARKIVAQAAVRACKGWQYFDWTKGGNGPWSDVYYRNDRKVVIGAIMRDM